ncbi:thiosulfate/3-mercaptopyruvate sulfurtransferase [Altererythrobacter xiamenensis]|uniref:Thiosulfate/3-mercaptopyruvate sulfurtransferase n=1 Tax=Altererythrobacter xiamenensis TaxID=1316679 RepID=A0A1Y6EFW4_9SPHN|nr:sulfurtransferase [Altererythrobacter xiamenensis]SMQ61508.1 thiosulfate/3-mercaptopyruvate sulfurtransferase [Altererythrobacter xiamenensis]
MDSLVSTDWLADALGAKDLVVVDASRHLPMAERDGHAEYLAGHIPGARFLDLAKLVDQTSDVPSALPRPEQLAEALAALGATPEHRIVFYDDSAVKTTARAWYLCRAHGMENVAILDGGLAKWKAEERPLESGEPEIEPAAPFDLAAPSAIRFKQDMLDNIEAGSEQVLDARDPGRFTGRSDDPIHNLPTGHIPGSCNLPFARLYKDDGTFKSPAELREIIESTGIDPARPVVTTCGSGVTACILLFALHLIGAEQTALYDGSWLDWAGDPGTPKATVSL